jgi:hypothetical protein
MAMDSRVKTLGEVKTEPLFDMVVDLNLPLAFGECPLGRRILFGAGGGSFEGPRLEAAVSLSGDQR